ncbi:NAD(P)/FAD-dependent oxidoreductase [Aquisalibacillus elongatus]|uniref:Sarcosine oxidase subunit alpha n=1 Tax=Aquisalibacillus elongatus TaxID=485577 RepID=A0A3N5C6X2_9BACI|nr:NAD(P)/FAD-dependent oxidoreductase [Aquisalibacillus elongatus]RPF52181.1 sarcosine oxidase subunit alpha [Aquisalibacillus elongatus]
MTNDVIIIGAGPAGLSAAITCAKHGMNVVVIDEYYKPGGRLLGQLYEEPDGSWWNGIKESDKLYNQAINSGVQLKLSVPVINIERQGTEWNVFTNMETLQANNLLVATGAAESPAPVPGWTLPGVMSVGAAQVMTNVQRVKPGEKGIIIGVNVLSAAIAQELKLANISVESMTLPKINSMNHDYAIPKNVVNSLLHVSHLSPSPIIKIGSNLMKYKLINKLALKFYPNKGIKMWDIPIQLKKAVTQIYGTDKVEGVTIANVDDYGQIIPKSEKSIEVDFVCISGGLYPLAELAAIAGCPFYMIEELGGYVPLHNERMETPLSGLFVAGNITGIEGAKVAAAQGTVAGLSIVNNTLNSAFEFELEEAIKQVRIIREENPIQFHPHIQNGRKKMQKYWNEYFANNQESFII